MNTELSHPLSLSLSLGTSCALSHSMYMEGGLGFVFGLIFPDLIPCANLVIFLRSQSDGKKLLFGVGRFITG